MIVVTWTAGRVRLEKRFATVRAALHFMSKCKKVQGLYDLTMEAGRS